MLIVVFAFEWREYDVATIDLPETASSVFEIFTDVPPTEIPPPPPPVQNPRIVEVSDEEVIEEIQVKFDIEVTEQTRVEEFEVFIPPAVELIKENPDEIFLVVEQNAEPVGGVSAFYKYVKESIRYPAQARRTNTTGKVFVEFVIERDGTISKVETVKGIGAGCDEEAVRIVGGSPKWNPGKQRGKPVRQRMVLPITFMLADR
jgi:protein TonB